MDEKRRETLRKELESAYEKVKNCWELCYGEDGKPLDKDTLDVVESIMGSLVELIGGSEGDSQYDSDCEYTML